MESVERPDAPDLTPHGERLPEGDADFDPRLRALALVQHDAQHAVDAEPGVPEAPSLASWSRAGFSTYSRVLCAFAWSRTAC